MNKARLEWVVSGLNHYVLTKNEEQFIKTAQEDFGKNDDLTGPQETRLETLYKEKSQFTPTKNVTAPSAGAKPLQKGRPRRYFVTNAPAKKM